MPKYKALRTKQTKSGPQLVIFSAPATEIQSWAGIPQKKQLGDVESTGFQRQENANRLKQIAQFYRDHRNTIQNPLLAAVRTSEGCIVAFHPAPNSSNSDSYDELGEIEIESHPFEERSLLELLTRAKESLEKRVPALRENQIDEAKLAKLREQARDRGYDLPDSESQEETEEDSGDEATSEESSGEPQEAIVNESHIVDFWEEIAARVQLLRELGDDFKEDEFLGYSKEAMISLLRPIIIVDGQHRLKGAILSAEESIDANEELETQIASLVDQGRSPTEAQEEVSHGVVRHLPVSLLMDEDPAEHVFQFVIVNQKATPISKPLLGTIISTTLSNDELKGIGIRLESSGIPLEDSRAIASLTRDSSSPFYNLVERGLVTDPKADLLAWSVFGGLVRMFRDLSGGKLFGERNDYAEKWKRDYLRTSEICDDFARLDYQDAYEYWKDGPWRAVFITFWTKIRDEFANTSDPETHNYWGKPRTSNIFNKISLTILAADFFQFLCEIRGNIESAVAVPILVDDWLKDVSRGYFNKNWPLQGVKKDSEGIRKKWAQLWVAYRKNPSRLPQLNQYRTPAGN